MDMILDAVSTRGSTRHEKGLVRRRSAHSRGVRAGGHGVHSTGPCPGRFAAPASIAGRCGPDDPYPRGSSPRFQPRSWSLVRVVCRGNYLNFGVLLIAQALAGLALGGFWAVVPILAAGLVPPRSRTRVRHPSLSPVSLPGPLLACRLGNSLAIGLPIRAGAHGGVHTPLPLAHLPGTLEARRRRVVARRGQWPCVK
jgi:hypothetical protein